MSEMRRSRARTIAAVLGILAVAEAAGSLGHPAVIERWYVWRLDSEDEPVRRAAAEALGRRRSVTAIPWLFDLLTSVGSEADADERERIKRERIERIRLGLSMGLTPLSTCDAIAARVMDAEWETAAAHAYRARLRTLVPNAFAIDALIAIGQPALDYASTLYGLPPEPAGRLITREYLDLFDSLGVPRTSLDGTVQVHDYCNGMSPMRSQPKTIALLAGLAAVAVAVAVGINWREIYYAFRPEARFWGRWEVLAAERTDSPLVVKSIVGFHDDGELALKTRLVWANGFLINEGPTHQWASRHGSIERAALSGGRYSEIEAVDAEVLVQG